jgi:hypothetical protein
MEKIVLQSTKTKEVHGTMAKKMVNRGWLAALAASALVALVGLLALTGSAHAAANSVHIDPATATVAPNGTVSVNVVAEAPTTKLGGWQINVTYDADVLSTSVGEDCGLGDSSPSTCNATTAGTIQFNGFSGSGLSGTKTLATLAFTAKGTAGQSSDITVAVVSFTESTAEAGETHPTTANGKITIAAPATATATTAATATPSPTVAVFANTGGSPSDGGSSSALPLVLAALGLVTVGGAAWAVARTRRIAG